MSDNNVPRPAHRPWLWLGLAFVLSFVAAGRWTIPLAAWVAPISMLRFVRQQPVLRGYLIGATAAALAGAVVWDGLVPFSGIAFYGFAVVTALIGFLPYLADRLMTQRLGGVLATLVFPAAATTLEYLLSFGDYGTWGATAYTQQNLTLLQLTSLTGLWGVTFLMFWTASVANAAWEARFEWTRVRPSALLYGGTLAAVLIFGSVRLSTSSTDATVTVAAVTGTRHAGNFLSSVDMNDLPAFRDSMRAVQQDYLTRTRQAARQGVRVVAWPEAAVPVLASDESQLIDRGRALARNRQIHLAMTLTVFPSDSTESRIENKIIWLDPEGQVRAEYLKARPVPGEPSIPGDGHLPLIDTPHGTWTAAICFDLDHHRLIRQAGQRGADVLLAPSNDWPAIQSIHAHMARVRSIENGVSLVRPTSDGLTLVTDPQGRTLAQMNHFAANEHLLIAPVPTSGTVTIYAMVGDAFAWLCVLGFVGLLAASVLQRRAKRCTQRAAQPA